MYIVSFFIAEVSLIEAREVQGTEYYENTPTESHSTSIQEKGTTEEPRGTSGKRTHEESKKRSHEGRATRRNKRK